MATNFFMKISVLLVITWHDYMSFFIIVPDKILFKFYKVSDTYFIPW